MASLVPHIPVDHADYGAIVPSDASSCAAFTHDTRSAGLAVDTAEALQHDVVGMRLIGLPHE